MLCRLNFTFQYKADMSHQARVALWAREAGFGSSAKKLGAGLNLLKTGIRDSRFALAQCSCPNLVKPTNHEEAEPERNRELNRLGMNES